jgi:anthranilate synthase component 1
MTIRSVLLRGREVRLQVGCGIVADSEPAREYQETINKAAAILRAVEEIA